MRDKLKGKRIMVWTFMGNARMYEALRDYGDRIDTIGLFTFKVDKTGTITESGVSISSMMPYINKWPHIRWLLTVANDGANSIFKALRDNTGGAQDMFCSELIRIMKKYPWCNGVDIDLEKGDDYGITSCAGGKWDDTGVFRVLHNPAYKGAMVLQKTYLDSRRVRHKNEGQKDQWYIADNHPAIVPPEQWDAVQEILLARSEQLAPRPPQKPSQPRSSRNQYPLTNKLFCPLCGQKLHHKWSNQGKNEYWACSTNVKQGTKACKGIWLPAEEANAWGDISEPTTAICYEDEYGMRHFTAYPKAEYELSDECPYQRKEK